jgi:hypothetical protein
MRVYVNCFARAYCYARVSSKRGQLLCEGILLCEGFFETRATSLRGFNNEVPTTQFQQRSSNNEVQKTFLAISEIALTFPIV